MIQIALVVASFEKIEEEWETEEFKDKVNKQRTYLVKNTDLTWDQINECSLKQAELDNLPDQCQEVYMSLLMLERQIGITECMEMKWEITGENTEFFLATESGENDVTKMLMELANEHKMYFEDDLLFSKRNLKLSFFNLMGRLTNEEINKAISYHN